MENSAWPLRIALVLSGLVAVAGVYLWSAWRRRREANLRYGRRLREARAPRRGEFEAEEDFSQEIGFEARVPPEDDYDIVLVKPVERMAEMPAVTQEIDRPLAPRRGTNQLAFGFGDEHGAVPPPKTPPPAEVLALYLRPQKVPHFAGPALETALAEVGMRFGDMNIYHHYGVGDLRAEKPVFSLANMFEPGQFDPLNMQDFTTQGLALFIRFPTPPVDGPVAFELFLNVAQRLAESLGAELLSEPRKALDSPVIERMRRIAARHAPRSRGLMKVVSMPNRESV